MDLELVGALILCVILTLVAVPVMLRLMRATAKVRLDKEIDKLIDDEERRMKARYGE